MKQAKNTDAQHPKDNRVLIVMSAILLLLIGVIAWTLTVRIDKKEERSTVFLDASQNHPRVELVDFYSGVDNGDSWQEIIETIGWPGDCLKEVTMTAGKQQVCIWYNDEASVVVILFNDRVVSKMKVGF